MNSHKKYPSNSSENLNESFYLSWQLYIFITAYWWFFFSGLADKFLNNLPDGLREIVGIILIFVGLPVLLFSVIAIFEFLDFLGIGKTKLIDSTSKQENINPVQKYNQTFTIDNNSTVNKNSVETNEINTASLQKALPLEKSFNTPKKINWDELNNTRKINGDLGEQLVYNLEKDYLLKIGRPDLAENVQHVAKEGDGHGYDIKSFFDNGSVKYIEVKATNSLTGTTFNLSRNEFHFLQSNLNNTFIYHVHNVNNEQEATMVVYSASKVIESPNISPSGYVVKM